MEKSKRRTRMHYIRYDSLDRKLAMSEESSNKQNRFCKFKQKTKVSRTGIEEFIFGKEVQSLSRGQTIYNQIQKEII